TGKLSSGAGGQGSIPRNAVMPAPSAVAGCSARLFTMSPFPGPASDPAAQASSFHYLLLLLFFPELEVADAPLSTFFVLDDAKGKLESLLFGLEIALEGCLILVRGNLLRLEDRIAKSLDGNAVVQPLAEPALPLFGKGLLQR